MEERKEAGAQTQSLCASLAALDESIVFFLLIILSVLLSFGAILIQRGQLVCTIAGEEAAAVNAPPVFPIRRTAGVLIVGSLGYFLVLALRAWHTAAEGEDCVAQRSASANVWAGIFVLGASLIRFVDLYYVERCQRTLVEGETLPA